jgi:hypothetical protein
MPKIMRVQVLKEYLIKLDFDDGVSGDIDLSYLVGKGIFTAWRDTTFFEEICIGSSGELAWRDGIDLCPDSLYLKITGKTPEDIFPILRYESSRA